MLLESVIAQICSGLVGQDLAACHKALEAASRQVGVYQKVEVAERRVGELAVVQVQYVVGKTPLAVVGMVVKVARDRSITIPIRRNSDGFIPSIIPTVGVDGGSINLGWRLK